MSKDNSNFFDKKQLWSEVKDELLSCYLRPYLTKILTTNRPVYYVDCFAGKGLFADGKEGSPLIALNIIDDCLKATTTRNPQINSCFVDANYADDLHSNLAGRKNIQIVSGRYEDTIKNLVSSHKQENVFLYIDPYGIKALDFGLFDWFATEHFRSIEMLINMNSFGFIREACHVLRASQTKVRELDVIIDKDLVEYDPSHMDVSEESYRMLTNIAGGDYWKPIIKDFVANKITGRNAEEMFTRQYCHRLNQNYKYVLNMPIRLKEGQHPKYRMIHVTNHEDGCVLMFENICKRWKWLGDIQTEGQLSLLEMTPENEVIDRTVAREKLFQHLRQYKNSTRLKIVLSDFLNQYGIIFTPQILHDFLKEYENSNAIIIERQPSFTPTGRSSKFYTENGANKIWIRSRR